MADYVAQQGRHHARPGHYGPTPAAAGRDVDFSMIFGERPPQPPVNARSQTMSAASAQSVPDRSQTMSSTSSQPVQLPPQQSIMQRAPPVRQPPLDYSIPPPPPSNYPSSQSQSSRPQASTHYIPPSQPQPQPQNLPQPVFPDRRPHPPQRIDSRAAQQNAGHRPVPNRAYPTAPGPSAALNSSSYRTQSLATSARPTYQPPGNSYNASAAQAFRQQPYANQPSRTTAQGRIVPERHDERTMSMTSYAREHDYSQTMSGRLIPNRRRESASADSALNNPDPRQSNVSYNTQYSGHTVVAGKDANISRTHPDDVASRSASMTSTIAPPDRTWSLANRPSMTSSISSPPITPAEFKRVKGPPLVYAALLSRVAETFRQHVLPRPMEKDGLQYQSAFTGKHAVSTLKEIMGTQDRNLALLLGRSLDAQKLFHDVTYDHRLRDSDQEVYQLRETLVDETPDVNGVFTLTTECYSPTCTPDRLCYSIACPKRVDQQKRLNMKPQRALKREDSRTSLHEESTDEQKLWINTVSKEVSDSVSDREKKRQEVISEICYTERDFVKDLEYLQDFWLIPLRSTNPAKPSPIPEHRREKFLRTVFANCSQVYRVNSQMAADLTRRQQQNPVVRNVGDIIRKYIPEFTPFINYGKNQLFGKYEYEREKQANPAFARFADETERLKESRKLELNGYLTKPTTRLARYPLLLENVMKYTADDNPDKQDISKAIEGIRQVLTQVNIESGKSENHFTLMQLDQQLSFRPGEFVDMKLTEEDRKLLFKGMLKKNPTDNMADIQTFLFDNFLIFVKSKTINKREELRVYRKPIPLGLLVIKQMDEVIPKLGLAKRPSSSLIPGARTQNNAPKQETTKQQGHPITFRHLGKGGFEVTLYCTSPIQREKWIKLVNDQQDIMKEHKNIFTKNILNEGFFMGVQKINCCVPIGESAPKAPCCNPQCGAEKSPPKMPEKTPNRLFNPFRAPKPVAESLELTSLDGGRKFVVGTDNGVFVMDRKAKDGTIKPRRALDVKAVTQIDVLEQHSILLVLSDKTLYSYSTDALDPDDSTIGPSKRGRKISGANFFKIGVFDGQHLVCCVKTSALSATIKVFKPMDSMTSSKKKSGFSRMLAGGQDVLRPHKEFYVPTETYSVHFLRSSLCVGCARGFEIVTLDTLVTQPLLDQADTSLDFVANKENLRPIHVERINRDFLLCYSDFSFFVNRHGWRAFPEWQIRWEGNPQSFAIFQPYILAFEPNFIEMRNMDTGTLVYILTAKNVRMLHSSTREILYAYEDELGEDVIASLDFWGHHGR